MGESLVWVWTPQTDTSTKSMGMDPKIDTATLEILKFSFFFIYCSISYVYTGLPLSQIGHVTWGLVTCDRGGGGYKDRYMRHGLFFNSTSDMWEYKRQGHATWSFLKPTCDIGPPPPPYPHQCVQVLRIDW